MQESEKTLEDTPERPASIAKIAYKQAIVMTRCEHRIENKVIAIVPREENKSLFQLPIFESITSTFCNAYTTVKQSNETINDIFNQTEESLGKGSKFIGSTIEKLPSVQIPAEELLENIKICFRLTFISTIEWCENVASSVVNAFNSLSITNEEKTEKTKEDKTKSFG